MAAVKFPFLGGAIAVLLCNVFGRRNVESAGAAEFCVERDITAAELIAGAVTILPDGEVPAGCKPFIDDYQINWGATAFGAATAVVLQDTGGATTFLSVLVANTLNALHRLSPTGVTQTGVTQGAALIGAPAALGGVSGKGLRVATTGSTPTLGSTFRIMVRGYFAKS